MEEKHFRDLASWWDVGKVQVRVFSQQDAAQLRPVVSSILQDLERNVVQSLFERDLRSFLNEWVKGALVPTEMSQIRDRDAKSSIFFSLDKMTKPRMLHIHLCEPT